MPTTKPLSDTQLARALNRQAHRGGKLTDYGLWYSEDARPDCATYPLGDRDWTGERVREARMVRAMGRKGGQATGGTKASTARANGQRGGRPKKGA